MSNLTETILTLVTNECECVETGECVCEEYNCNCECSCNHCTQEYDIVDTNEED